MSSVTLQDIYDFISTDLFENNLNNLDPSAKNFSLVFARFLYNEVKKKFYICGEETWCEQIDISNGMNLLCFTINDGTKVAISMFVMKDDVTVFTYIGSSLSCIEYKRNELLKLLSDSIKPRDMKKLFDVIVEGYQLPICEWAMNLSIQ